MDTPDISPQQILSGMEFEQSLANLGLDAEVAFWAYDIEQAEHVLVFVTDFMDQLGPLAISNLLFKAYNASALPQQIDPFLVRFFSINQPVGQELAGIPSGNWSLTITRRDGRAEPEELSIAKLKTYGLEIRPEWVIKKRPHKQRSTVEILRRWRRFENNVEKLAA